MRNYLNSLKYETLEKLLKKHSNWWYSMYLKTDRSIEAFYDLYNSYEFEILINLELNHTVEELQKEFPVDKEPW